MDHVLLLGLLSSFFTKHHPLRRPPPPQPAADNAANGSHGNDNHGNDNNSSDNGNSITATDPDAENVANNDTSSEHHVAVEINNKPESVPQASCRG